MDWSLAIRYYRRSRGYTQCALACEVGVDVTTVSRWERGLVIPEIGMQKKLRDLMRRRDDALLGSVRWAPGIALAFDFLNGERILTGSDAASHAYSVERSEAIGTSLSRYCFGADLVEHIALMDALKGQWSDVVIVRGAYSDDRGVRSSWTACVSSDPASRGIIREDVTISLGAGPREFSVINFDEMIL